jgi:uncharacterized protein YcaQ
MTTFAQTISEMKPDQASAFRMAAHHFADEAPAALTDICADVCGVQAQVMSSAFMALWARNHSLSRHEIYSALWEKRTLVKTSLMRQTLHVIPSADFSLYIAAFKRSRSEALQRSMFKYGGARSNEIAALIEIIVDELCAGPLTQPDLMERILPKVSNNVRKYMKLAWSIQTFRPALVEGLICYGPEQHGKATLVRSDQWLRNQKPLDEVEAKQEILRRYLRAYGPATLADFSRWSGMTVKEARPVWESLRDDFAEVKVDDSAAFLLREDIDRLAEISANPSILRMLPAFDPYLLAHAQKDHLVEAANYKRVYRNQGWISPVILLDGRVIGVWFERPRAKQSTLEIEPFQLFSKKVRSQIETEAAGLATFLNRQLEVRFKT